MTTFPRCDSRVNGSELIHLPVSASSGAGGSLPVYGANRPLASGITGLGSTRDAIVWVVSVGTGSGLLGASVATVVGEITRVTGLISSESPPQAATANSTRIAPTRNGSVMWLLIGVLLDLGRESDSGPRWAPVTVI